MGQRLLDYNVFASHQYEHRPTSTYVIYLRKGVEVAESPYIRRSIDGEEIHRFYFKVIKLWGASLRGTSANGVEWFASAADIDRWREAA